MRKYCDFCMNAFVEPELTPENDLSYLHVGKCNPYAKVQMHIRSGDARPTAIVVSIWDEKCQRNVDVVEYSMKYCPECGRRLLENEQNRSY